jgi:hypothetical protein
MMFHDREQLVGPLLQLSSISSIRLSLTWPAKFISLRYTLEKHPANTA